MTIETEGNKRELYVEEKNKHGSETAKRTEGKNFNGRRMEKKKR